jgi:hypothetical protein
MPPPSSLPVEARQEIWARLWRVLLQEPPNDTGKQLVSPTDNEPEETNDAAAQVASGKEVTKTLA